MATDISHDELERLIGIVAEFRERTGESVTSIAARAGVRREHLSRMLSGEYPHGPQFEVVAKLAKAVGRRIEFPAIDD